MSGNQHWRVILAGGGTGGHLIPGLALAEEMLRRDPYAEITFVGMEGGIEQKLVPAFGHRLVITASRRATRALGARVLDLARKAWSVWRSRGQCLRLFREQHPHVVVGLGGYSSTAPLLAARSLGLPTVLMEQNAIPGRANRFLARHADLVIAQFEECIPHFPGRPYVEVLGNPVLRSTLAAGAVRAKRAVPSLLVMGGSQGARALNDALCTSASGLRAAVPGLEVIALTGPADAERVRARLEEAGLPGRVIPFSTRMGELYACADVVLARAGATTIAELTALGLPSILVPYPHAADNHQEANARILERAGAAEVVLQEALSPEHLIGLVRDMLAYPLRRVAMRGAARRLGRPDCARGAVDAIEALRADADTRSA